MVKPTTRPHRRHHRHPASRRLACRRPCLDEKRNLRRRIFAGVCVEDSLLAGVAVSETGSFPCLAAHRSELLRLDLFLARVLLQHRKQFLRLRLADIPAQTALAESLGDHLPKCAVGAPVQVSDEPCERLVGRQRREHIERQMIRVEPHWRRLAVKGRPARARKFESLSEPIATGRRLRRIGRIDLNGDGCSRSASQLIGRPRLPSSRPFAAAV